MCSNPLFRMLGLDSQQFGTVEIIIIVLKWLGYFCSILSISTSY